MTTMKQNPTGTTAHEHLANHAFDCRAVYTRAYVAALGAGRTEAQAHEYATAAHDEAVAWVFANVGLD